MKRFLVLSSLAITILMGSADADTPDPVPTKLVNHLTMNQWVRSSESGELSGRVFLPSESGQAEAFKDVSVSMLSRNGEITRVKTDAEGLFKMKNVNPGVYALTARGENVFACCAMHVVDETFAPGTEIPSQAEIAVANVDYTIVNTAIIRYMPPTVKEYDVSIDDVDFDGFKDRVCGEELFRVARSENGMKGRIHLAGASKDGLIDARNTNVFLFDNGMEIDRAVTDRSGSFKFENIDPGQYSLLAIGSGGIGLMGFELVNEDELTASNSQVGSDGTRLVGFGHHGRGHHGCCCCCEEFAMQIAPMPEVVNVVEDVVISESIVGEGEILGGEVVMDGCCGPIEGDLMMDGFGAPIPGGGFSPTGGYAGGGGAGYGGGGGGGGSFGGIGGGLSGIAGLAGVAAVVAATSDDDNNPIAIPGASSRIAPPTFIGN